MMQYRARLLRACAPLLAPTRFLGRFSLRAGVAVIALSMLPNAVLAMAGLTALFADIETVAGLRTAAGRLMPPGSEVNDPQLRMGAAFNGVYFLAITVSGCLAAARRSIRGAMAMHYLLAVGVVAAAGILVAAAAYGAWAVAVFYVVFFLPLVYSAAVPRAYAAELRSTTGGSYERGLDVLPRTYRMHQ
jgi:hypothetical protein